MLRNTYSAGVQLQIKLCMVEATSKRINIALQNKGHRNLWHSGTQQEPHASIVMG